MSAAYPHSPMPLSGLPASIVDRTVTLSVETVARAGTPAAGRVGADGAREAAATGTVLASSASAHHGRRA